MGKPDTCGAEAGLVMDAALFYERGIPIVFYRIIKMWPRDGKNVCWASDYQTIAGPSFRLLWAADQDEAHELLR
jgi:hypothetical protein